MADTVRFGWLSDVHLPLAGVPLRYWNMKRLLGWLNWQRKRRFVHTRQALDLIVADMKEQKPDHVLVSGDLINLALPSEYKAASDWLGTLGPPDTVSIVPGNHDIYVEDRALREGLPLWNAYMTGDADVSGSPGVYPYLRRVGPVALIGVNSAVPTPVGFATGHVDRPQTERLEAMLARTKALGLIRLVMIHHPPLPGLAAPRRALVDAQAVAAVLARAGAELVIHGHNHTETFLTHAGIPVVGAASASAARPYGNEPAARYHLVSVSREGANALIEVETRGLGTAARPIAPIAVQKFQSHSTG